MYIYISPNFVFLEILSNLNFNTFHNHKTMILHYKFTCCV